MLQTDALWLHTAWFYWAVICQLPFNELESTFPIISVESIEEKVELNESNVTENSDSAKENESEDTEHIPFNPTGRYS